MTQPIRNVLFLCTGNSARSIMAEVLLNHHGAGRFRAFSAGSYPKGEVNPFTVQLLQRSGFSTKDLRSKGWEEFAGPKAPVMDFVITVCDKAAGEVCPVWPGQPITAHWGFVDPAVFDGSVAEKAALFNSVFAEIERRIRLFCALPMAALDRLALQREVRALGAKYPAKT